MRLDLSVSSHLRLARSRVAGMVLVACALGACGDDDGGGTTTPPPPPTPPMDAGPSDDTGPGNRDTGPGDRDTGPADRDTGPTDRDAGSVTNVPGRHDVDIVVEDQMRHLIVYVPESVAGAVAAPVVFMVHGTSGDGERFFNSTSWNEVADAEGIIVVYPDALTYCFHQDENGDGDFDDPDEQHVTTKWNSGFFSSNPLCTAEEIAALPAGQRARADHPLRDDVAFFLAMIDRLSVEAVIDTRRVYATGFSNGAQMTSRLGNDAPDRFAAVASHAGYLDVEPIVPSRPIGFAISVGAQDPTVVTAPDTLPLDETIVELPFFMRMMTAYLSITQLADTYEHTTAMVGTRTVSRFSFTTSTVGADNRLEFAVIEGLDHMYPSIETQLWTFFSAHSLP